MGQIFAFVWLLSAALFACGAMAAEITPLNKDGVTRGILISGRIMPGDRQKFANIALSTDKAVVILSSEGGNVWDALEIGRAIRLKGFPTYVIPNDVCASACALIWLAGTPRQMSANARIGFHAVYMNTSGATEVSSSGNAIVGSYLNSLGLPEAAIFEITSASPNEIQWITPTQFAKLGINAQVREYVNNSPPPQRFGNSGADLAPTTPTNKQLEAQALEFLMRYLSFENEDANRSLQLVATALGQQVFHFGKWKTRHEVLEEYSRFIERWPSRKFTLRPGSFTVSCHSDQSKCLVDALLEWDVTSLNRNAKSTGVTTRHMELNRDGNSFAIAAIDGKIS